MSSQPPFDWPYLNRLKALVDRLVYYPLSAEALRFKEFLFDDSNLVAQQYSNKKSFQIIALKSAGIQILVPCTHFNVLHCNLSKRKSRLLRLAKTQKELQQVVQGMLSGISKQTSNEHSSTSRLFKDIVLVDTANSQQIYSIFQPQRQMNFKKKKRYQPVLSNTLLTVDLRNVKTPRKTREPRLSKDLQARVAIYLKASCTTGRLSSIQFRKSSKEKLTKNSKQKGLRTKVK